MDLKKSFRNFSRNSRYYFQQIDLILFATVVAISVFSIINLAGIALPDQSITQKQALLIGAGICVMIATSFFNYRYLKNYSASVLILYGGTLLLLVLTMFSPPIRNVHAWIVIGGFRFEPSELMKLTLIVVLAKYFSQRHIHISQFRHILISGIYAFLPILLVLAQPDLGSAVILGLIWFGILMAAGINRKQFFLLVTVAIVGAYLAWIFALKPYQKERIVSFINPYRDPTGIGYNIIQSKIAFGSGGWFGNGFGNGTQATLGFLPEPYNDFVFSALGEQFGFISATAIFAAILLIIFRILKIGRRASHNFGKLFAVGMSIFIFAHATISAAVNIGLMPITGIPFSFLSYGGSHLISIMLGLGIAQSIKRYG